MSTSTFTTKGSKPIQEWLHKYKLLTKAEMDTYVRETCADHELTSSLFQLFEGDTLDLGKEVLTPVCHQLFEFYRSGNPELKYFTLELVPLLVLAYLVGVTNNDQEGCSSVEACLLGIYTLEHSEKYKNSTISRFTIPNLACPSIYHKPPPLATLALTDNTLQGYYSNDHVIINVATHLQVKSINSQNRLRVLSSVMNRYYQDVAKLSSRSHQMLCKMCIRVSQMGFKEASDEDTASDINMSSSATSSRGSEYHSDHLQCSLRIPLSSEFLVELLDSIYFVTFNGHEQLGIAALEAIHERAIYEMWPKVLLVTNTMKNTLISNSSGNPMGPMGINIPMFPNTSKSAFENTITNASFRVKKLPDDINVPDPPKKEEQ